MKENKSVEAMDTRQMQIHEEPRVCNQARMSHSKAVGRKRNNSWKLCELMKEDKSIPEIGNSQMQIRQESKGNTLAQMSPEIGSGNERNNSWKSH
jgi:hypothetical protein